MSEEPVGGANGAADAVELTDEAALEARVAELEKSLEDERDRSTDYMRRWHAAQADFANFKRRAQQEQEQRDRVSAIQALAPVLNAIDSLERAFASLPPSLRGFTWIEGIALVELQLRRALEIQGITVIDVAPGQPHDPMRHEAIGVVETEDVPEGVVAVVVQRGYEANGLLVRPALVQLARAPQAKPEETGGSATEETPEA